MKNKSIWSYEICGTTYESLKEDIDVDVLIIGGGMTGINVAYNLLDSGLSVCLVEKNLLGSGVTSRTTGKLTYLQGDIFKIKIYQGLLKTKMYIESQIEAINLAKKIIKKEKIDCDLEKVNSYLVADARFERLRKNQRLLESMGIKTFSTKSLPNENKKEKSFYVKDTYVFHPIKYIQKLAKICFDKGISIYENTKIISMTEDSEGYVCYTENNRIRTKYVVLATHYPYFFKPFWLIFKAYLEKSYIEAFKVDKSYNFSAISIEKPIFSMRYYSKHNLNYQLYLSQVHNLAIKNNDEANFQKLVNEKNTKVEYLWSNKDIMTIDSLPFIGKINNKLLIGTGYNTWGMTNGVLAGKILSDIILERENKYIELFNPRRKSNALVVGRAFLVMGSSLYSYMKTKIKKQKAWYSLNVKFATRKGEKVGIYIDSEKRKHIVFNKCPHMKCSLVFNEVEKTWDCPCHGSRFDIDGKCIEGPSNYDISYKE
ncbi:MAG: FAD-dependent oxidoreductase [bacterium]|nr:FAD-dependent oxidoreductase [bacterium]